MLTNVESVLFWRIIFFLLDIQKTFKATFLNCGFWSSLWATFSVLCEAWEQTGATQVSTSWAILFNINFSTCKVFNSMSIHNINTWWKMKFRCGMLGYSVYHLGVFRANMAKSWALYFFMKFKMEIARAQWLRNFRKFNTFFETFQVFLNGLHYKLLTEKLV